MSGLDNFLYGPMGQVYTGTQQVIQDSQGNQQRDLKNQTTAAELPGVVGQSQSLAAKGQVDTAMAPSNIDAGQAANAEKVSASEVQQMSDMGVKFGQAGALLQGVPSAARPQALQTIAQKLNIPLDHPAFAKLVDAANADPDKMADLLTTVSGQMAATSSQARNAIALENVKQGGENSRNTADNARHVQVGEGNNAATKYAADAAANSRVKAAELKNARAVSMLSEAQKWVYLNSIPESERSPDEQSEFSRLTKMRMTMKAASVPDTAPAILNGQAPKTQMQTAGDAAAGISEPKATTPQPNPGAPGEDPQIQAGAKAAWGSYDPKGYDYKIVNGKLLRKAK